MQATSEDVTTYYPIHIWHELDSVTVEEIRVSGWNWDHNNGLGGCINSVDVGDSATVFGARMICRPTGPEVLSDRLHWLHPFNPSRDGPVAEWITKQNKNLHWAKIQERTNGFRNSIFTDLCFVGITETFDHQDYILFIRCAGDYVYETAFTKKEN